MEKRCAWECQGTVWIKGVRYTCNISCLILPPQALYTTGWTWPKEEWQFQRMSLCIKLITSINSSKWPKQTMSFVFLCVLLGFLLTTPFAMDFQCWHSAWSFEISLRSLFVSMESSILSVESCLSLLPKLWPCSSWNLLSSLSLISSCCLKQRNKEHI